MVHALHEIRRALKPAGILIDLRPISDQWPVEVVSARETRETGRVSDLPPGLEDDNAANQAMINVERNNWFVRERQEFFPLHYVWDTTSEMEEWMDEEWAGFIRLDQEARRVTRSAWALGDADSQVRVRVKMLITRWVKSDHSG